MHAEQNDRTELIKAVIICHNLHNIIVLHCWHYCETVCLRVSVCLSVSQSVSAMDMFPLHVTLHVPSSFHEALTMLCELTQPCGLMLHLESNPHCFNGKVTHSKRSALCKDVSLACNVWQHRQNEASRVVCWSKLLRNKEPCLCLQPQSTRCIHANQGEIFQKHLQVHVNELGVGRMNRSWCAYGISPCSCI